MHFHRWSKWEQFDEDYVKVTRYEGLVPYVQTWQEKHCEVCNKVKRERVN